MKEKIYLFWYKLEQGHGNFGDELNPYIISRLSDHDIKYINASLIMEDKGRILKSLIIYLFQGEITLTYFFKYLYYNFIKNPRIFLAIGSILQICKTDRVTVWGSGIISSDSNVPNANYLAVRGYKTINRIKELGYNPPSVVGDPALLLPLIYKKTVKKNFKVGIVPHHMHYNYYKDHFHDQFIVINLLDKIEDIINQINQCEYIISTSLHGVITAHAYSIKSIWGISDKKKLVGDNIKFADYFSSVDISDYIPLRIEDLIGMDADNIIEYLSENYNDYLLPDELNISKIQENLLEVFPYKKSED